MVRYPKSSIQQPRKKSLPFFGVSFTETDNNNFNNSTSYTLLPPYCPSFFPSLQIMLPKISILLVCLFICISSSSTTASDFLNLTIPHQHPNPEAVVQQVQRKLNDSISRRQMLLTDQPQCLTGNPIDDCWRCDPDWEANRQHLADCAIGFGQAARGGKGGRYYLVSDSSDHDTVNPVPGTLRHAVIQDEPLWIIFQSSMLIKLKHELIVNSYKTIDGRGAEIQITGNGCITLQYISNVIIHNIHVYNCQPSGNTNIRSSPTHVGHRGQSDGDGISIFSSRNIWIDHCALSHCTDGLIDAIMASTAITISNNYFSHHDEVMLLGHDDRYMPDSGMQVTIAFNHFGEGLVQRMPRCRRGYIHVVNNDFTQWEMYAIGGSANPTINSQGNRYTAPVDPNAKEVTKRVDTDENVWSEWNWRTEGDELVNGAYFVPSGASRSVQYAKASSVEPRSAYFVNQLTMGAGVLGGPRDNGISMSYGGGATTGVGGGDSGSTGDGDLLGMIFGSGTTPTHSPPTTSTFLSLLIILITMCSATHPHCYSIFLLLL